MKNGPEHALAQRIIGRDYYFDSIKVYVDRAISEEEDRQILSLVGSCRKLNPMLNQAWWCAGRVLHQPSQEALRFFASRFSKIVVSRVDVAFDLVTALKCDAIEIQDFLRQHLVQRWHGEKKVQFFKTTLYFGAAKSRNNLIVYSDKVSRINGLNCCHIEWKISSASAVRAAGLDDIESLLQLDIRDFWQKRLKLRRWPESALEIEQLAKDFCGQPKRRKPWVQSYGKCLTSNRFLRIGSALLRAAVPSELKREDQLSVQEVIQGFGRLGKHFPEISSSWILGPDPTAHD